MLRSLLDPFLNFPSAVRAWRVFVSTFVKEELAVRGLHDWLADGNDIFSRLAQRISLKLEDLVVYKE